MEQFMCYCSEGKPYPRIEITYYKDEPSWMYYVSKSGRKYRVSRLGNIIDPFNGPRQIVLEYDYVDNPNTTEEIYDIVASTSDEDWHSDTDLSTIEYLLDEFEEPAAEWERNTFNTDKEISK